MLPHRKTTLLNYFCFNCIHLLSRACCHKITKYCISTSFQSFLLNSLLFPLKGLWEQNEISVVLYWIRVVIREAIKLVNIYAGFQLTRWKERFKKVATFQLLGGKMIHLHHHLNKASLIQCFFDGQNYGKGRVRSKATNDNHLS